MRICIYICICVYVSPKHVVVLKDISLTSENLFVVGLNCLIYGACDVSNVQSSDGAQTSI